jgi:hypothetical protein
VLKINPEEWNNVPKVIYEAIVTLVTAYDANKKQNI